MPTAAEVIAELTGPGGRSEITTDTVNGVEYVLRGEGVVSFEETM